MPRRGADLYIEPKQSEEKVIESLESFGKPGKPLVGGSAARPGFMTMLGSFEGYLMIYKDIQMVWTTKLPLPPVFVARANFQGKHGLIVTFSDEGHLHISYLGTD